MSPESPENTASDLRGANRMVSDAVIGVTDLVESLHRTITTFGGIFGGEETSRTGGITGIVYNNIRRVTGLVTTGLDAALARLGARLGEQETSRTRDIVVGALNGVIGDYLAATDNPLAVAMHLRHDGRRIEGIDASLRRAVRETDGRIVLTLHGSCATEHHWSRDGHDHAAALARDLGYVPIHVRYNSGRHISENGADLSDLLERFVTAFPEPLEVVILGHSMGGLVARSAYHAGETEGDAWTEAVSALVFLGTPHHGVPLERYGNYVDNALDMTSYSAPFSRLGKVRSAGITDLRYGNLLREDWEGRDRFAWSGDRRRPLPLPGDVDCYAVAVSKREKTDDLSRRFHWDGMVPVDSALGRHDEPARDLAFPEDHRWVGSAMDHMDLLGDPEVYEVVKRWLSD